MSEQIAIGIYKGQVVLDFGKNVQHVLFTPDQAREIAKHLNTTAYNIDRKLILSESKA